MNDENIELAQAKPVHIDGFPRMAAKMASDADKTTTIYRRFDELSARNLLYLEAEIAELEAQQKRYDAEDLKLGDRIVLDSHSDWLEVERLATARHSNGDLVWPHEAKKRDLALKIREKLKEYYELLGLHQILLNSPPPAETTVKAMRNWFFDNDSGNAGSDRTAQLLGSSTKMFDDANDLVALRVPANQDRLSAFLINHMGIFFQTESPDGCSTYISERSVARCSAVLSSMLSAVLLFGSILSLYFVNNPYALLGMLGGWTVIFAICVGWLTNARRDQVFGATAAYAAVLVVFVSGTLGGATIHNNAVVLGNWTCTPR